MEAANTPPSGSGRQFTRSIPPRLSPVVGHLELFQPKIVTLAQLGEYLAELCIDADPAEIAHDLQKLGWLLPLRTRGRWEFAPAARAGAIPSGDPFVELRATLQRRDLPVALAYDSAAWLQGLSSRQPQRQVLATKPSVKKFPPALSDFRVTRTWGALEPDRKDKLPVWRVSTLLAKMAIEPANFHDWPNVMEWLPHAFQLADRTELEWELSAAPNTARVRLAYLADRAGFTDLAGELMRKAQPRGLTYLGRDRTRGRFIRKYDLMDSLLVPSVKP